MSSSSSNISSSIVVFAICDVDFVALLVGAGWVIPLSPYSNKVTRTRVRSSSVAASFRLYFRRGL